MKLDDIHETIRRALESAGLDTRSGPMHDVTEIIRRSLSNGQGAAASPRDADVPRRARMRPLDPSVVDVQSFDVSTGVPPLADFGEPALDPTGSDVAARPGEFVLRSFANRHGARPYKLYLPRGYCGEPIPLVVMLHGCTQDPDDFALGTRMNDLADRHGFASVYPAQVVAANGSKCWNWFDPKDQSRERGEPAVIAGIVREVTSTYAIDPQRVYVAGLSAGAAMAVTLGATYPDVFAAVGAHSGLPHGSASDLASALAAMKRSKRAPFPARSNPAGGAGRPASTPALPTIVFHGDRDSTVSARNGADIAAHAGVNVPGLQDPLVEQGASGAGRRFTRTTRVDAAGRSRTEHWVLHGGGHAWAGGEARGSYTDPTGPDASSEMIRFFWQHRLARAD